MSKLKLLINSGLVLTVLSGCGLQKDELKKYLKCGMAANQLEMTVAENEISKKLGAYIDKNNIDGSARDAMLLAQEVRDDLSLHNKNLNGQIKILVKVYNSPTCMKIHEQEKIRIR